MTRNDLSHPILKYRYLGPKFSSLLGKHYVGPEWLGVYSCQTKDTMSHWVSRNKQKIENNQDQILWGKNPFILHMLTIEVATAKSQITIWYA